MDVGTNAAAPNLVPCDAIHLIEAASHITGLVAPAQARVNSKLAPRFNADACVHALIEKLVDESCTDKHGRRCRSITKIVMRKIERNPLFWIHSHAEIAASNSCAERDAVRADAL